MDKIYFAKTKSDAKLPSKRQEDAGYDLYACFPETELLILPQQTVLVPTGVACAFSEAYVMIIKERGSTGSKGIAQRAGVVDSGYRNEILLPITNLNAKPLVIAKQPERFQASEYIVHDYDKALAQALVLPLPQLETVELDWSELKTIASERGLGRLGSSGK